MGAARFTRMLLVLFAVLGVLVGPKPAESGDKKGEALANAILAHVRNSLPSAAAHSVDDQYRRIRMFAEMVTTLPVPPADPAALKEAAIAAIDAANGPTATADSLVHAAINGVWGFFLDGKVPPSECSVCKGPSHKPLPLPSSRQVGTIWVISMPSLKFPEGYEECPPLAHYFDHPKDGVSGLVLDLRGNQGGFLPVAVCVASQFVNPKTPLIRLSNGSRSEVLVAVGTGRKSPITLPLAVFVDRDTESGALAIAAALQDAGRAKLVGESKDKAAGRLFTVLSTPGRQDTFTLPVGEMEHVGGAPLSAGIQVDVAASPKDDTALLAAACTQFPGCGQP